MLGYAIEDVGKVGMTASCLKAFLAYATFPF